MLTEQQVQNSFRKLVSQSVISDEQFEKAEELLENLRAESPLRFRLTQELEQLRKLQTVGSKS